MSLLAGMVLAVSKSPEHSFCKTAASHLLLIAGEGVAGDAHAGVNVKHRSRVKINPHQPNLRQIHLIHNELLEELQQQGFRVDPATLGENITTVGLDLLALPTNTVLKLGAEAEIRITGLRNPCYQLDNFQQGLTAAVLDRDEHGKLIRKAGVMGIVLKGGKVSPADRIVVVLPALPHHRLEPV